MKLLLSFRYQFQMRWQPFESFIDVDIYTDPEGEPQIVVLKDPGVDASEKQPFGSGISVTNAIGEIAYGLVMDRGLLPSWKHLIWVEYYPERPGIRKGRRDREDWSQVTFWGELDHTLKTIHEPNWTSMTRERFEALIAS